MSTTDIARSFRPGPAGHTPEVLEEIRWRTGAVDQDVRISARQAKELADIGEQLLRPELDPPLNPIEKQSIQHLVDLVSSYDHR